LVTDASDPGPAAIELGVYAPRMANLPTFGVSGLEPETVLLGFSPNVNGLNIAEDGVSDFNRQGLGSTILDNDLDPVNIFPFDPDNTTEEGNNYSPMWDAHLNMWTDEVVLDIEADNGLYNIFEEVAYTITVTNNGDAEATNVVVDAGLPSGMVFASANFDSGNYDLFFEEWTINSVAPGQTATLNLTLFTLTENVNITNNVQIVAMDQVDSDSSNNFDSVTIRPFSFGGVGNADGTIDLELSLTAPSANFVQFENVDFMLTLTNNGPDDATGVFINAPIPSGFAFTGYQASAGDYDYFTQRWYVPELASGATATLRLTLFTLDRNRDLANAVEVFAADQNDSDSTPGNLAGNNPVEDDEAVLILIPSLTGESNDGIAFRSSDNNPSTLVYTSSILQMQMVT